MRRSGAILYNVRAPQRAGHVVFKERRLNRLLYVRFLRKAAKSEAGRSQNQTVDRVMTAKASTEVVK